MPSGIKDTTGRVIYFNPAFFSLLKKIDFLAGGSRIIIIANMHRYGHEFHKYIFVYICAQICEN